MQRKILLCLEIDTWGEAYGLLGQITATIDNRILEFGQVHAGKIVLLAEVGNVPVGTPKDSIIDNPHPQLLEAYFKLSTAKVADHLCVLEDSSLLNLLRAANLLMTKNGYNCLEIYRACNGYPRAWALLADGQAPIENTPIGSTQARIVKGLNKGLLNFLN